MFEKRVYYFNVMENASYREHPVVGRVVATDQDEGDNADVRYSIIGGNTERVFEVDKASGDITLLKQLDRETRASYSLIVRAQDLGNPPKSNTTKVIVMVEDVNDVTPRFSSSSYFSSVVENVQKGYSVLQVKVGQKLISN